MQTQKLLHFLSDGGFHDNNVLPYQRSKRSFLVSILQLLYALEPIATR